MDVQHVRAPGRRRPRDRLVRAPPILHDPEEIPSIEEAALSPTEFPFTQDDFELQIEHALELMPEIVGDESVGVKYAINGLISLTPDGMPILGETPEVKGLWSAAAVWVKEGPGVGKSRGRVDGARRVRDRPAPLRHRALPRRTRRRARTSRRAHVRGASTRPTASCTRASSGRPTATLRLSPMHARHEALGAVFYEAAGWERPQWYESQRAARRGVRRRSRARPSGTRAGGRRSSTPSTSRCASAPASSTSRRSRSSTSAAPARSTRCSASRCARWTSPVGRVVYTPLLSPSGGFKSDLTIMRLGRRPLPRRHRRRARHGRPQVVRATTCPRTARRSSSTSRRPGRRSASGARAPATSSRRSPATTSRTRASRSAPAGRSRSARRSCWPRASPTSATSAGSSTCRSSRARGCGTRSGRPASRTASSPCGIGVYGTTGRLEKGYRAYGAELETEYNVVEAGMARPKVKEQDFIGKEAHLRHRERRAGRDPLHADRRRPHLGERREALPARPRADRDARRHAAHRRQGPPLVRHERRRRPVARQVHPARLPAARARRRGRRARRRVHGRALPGDGRRSPARRPIFDPENARIRS